MNPRKCAVCESSLEGRKPETLYCSPKCKRRASTVRRRESGWSKKWEAKRAGKVRIGLHIRDEALNQPTRASKALWDGIGRWSKQSSECGECSQTVYRHAGHGVCERCYEAMRRADRADDGAYKSKKALSDKTNNRTSKRRKEALEWIGRAKKGEVENTPAISNLLENL